jgi:hypothetical protein
MSTQVATQRTRSIARPLKALIPMIQGEIQLGNSAGREHYRRAGEMLIEAKDQVPHGRWGTWLTKNFDLSPQTARVYMQWARIHDENARGAREMPASLRSMRGDADREREQRQSKQQQEFRRVLRDVARDDFVQERQRQDEEIRLHRELAEELITAGYRALATKLHPDRGGSKEAMTRLTRVRDELNQVAQTRRFI